MHNCDCGNPRCPKIAKLYASSLTCLGNNLYMAAMHQAHKDLQVERNSAIRAAIYWKDKADK